jgi:hypothetical protein
MNLAGRHTRHFEVHIPWLLTEHEITDRAADQPCSPTGAANHLLNLAQCSRKRGIFDAKAGRHLDPCFAEERRGFFR